MKKNDKLNKGFTLVETLVAISIFTMSLLGIMSVLSSSISSTNYAKQKMVASYLAQEGIEYMRNMRDTEVLYGGNSGWSSFKSKLSSCNANGTNDGCRFNTVFPHNFLKCNNPHECTLYIGSDGSYSTDSSGTDSGFIRKVWKEIIDQDKEVKIFSKVEWTQGSGPHSITFSENLFNWVE